MKRFYAIVAAMLVAASLGACGSKTNDEASSQPSSVDSSSSQQQVTNKEVSDGSAIYSAPTAEKPDSDENVFEIKEKMFITQCNDIYINPDDYRDKSIKLEGMYDEYTDPDTNKTYCYVIRKGPGCCGNDGVAGFEILFDGEKPKLNDWVEVVGKLETVLNDGGFAYEALRLERLTVLDVRGAEFVVN